MQRGAQPLDVGPRESGEHAADEEVAAGHGCVGVIERGIHAGLDARAHGAPVVLDDGLVDRHSLGAGGEAAKGVRGLFPGGLDKLAEEAGGERLAVRVLRSSSERRAFRWAAVRIRGAPGWALIVSA